MSEETQYISIRNASKLSGLCPQTLRKLSDQNKIKSYKTFSGQRRFDKKNLEEFCSATSKHNNKKNYIYARVSPLNKDDLENQIEFIRNINECTYSNYTVIADISPATNFKRKGLLALLDACISQEIGNIVIASKDRLATFGFDLIETIIQRAGGKIIILTENRQSSASYSEHEISEEFMTIARIYCGKKSSL